MSVDLNYAYFTSRIPSAATASSAYIPIPSGGTLVAVNTVLEGAITVADCVLTVTCSAITTGSAGALTAGTITVATAGSAVGDIDELLCNTPIPQGGYVKIAGDGGATGAKTIWITIKVRR